MLFDSSYPIYALISKGLEFSKFYSLNCKNRAIFWKVAHDFHILFGNYSATKVASIWEKIRFLNLKSGFDSRRGTR
jgi:hypothetical protein